MTSNSFSPPTTGSISIAKNQSTVNRDASWGQRLRNPRSVRFLMGFVAFAGAVLLIYASVVPLIYEPKSWQDAVERFLRTPWLDLDISNRSDWFANALVVIPLGFLALGAVDWKRQSRWPMLLMFIPILFTLFALIIGIEFLQVWFPPRTVSQNDIAAGMVGACLGIFSWMLLGRTILGAVEHFLELPYGTPRIAWLGVAYAICLLIYSAMPFDVVLTRSEWQEKLNAGRIKLNPFQELDVSLHSLLPLFLSAARVAPIGFVAQMMRSTKETILIVVGTAFVLELVQVPIFTRYASMTEAFAGIVGGLCGALLVRFMPFGAKLARKRSLWFVATVLWSLATVFAFVAKVDRIATNSELRERFDGLWNLPLVRYYYASEFSAGTNLLGKLFLFAGLGFLLTGMIYIPNRCKARLICFGLASLWVLFLGIMIELLQVALVPYVADISDLLTYALGGCCGAIAYGLIFGFGLPRVDTVQKSTRAPA